MSMHPNATISALYPSSNMAIYEIERSPLKLLHVAVVAACAFGFALDLMELAFGSVLSVIFSTPPHKLAGSGLQWLLAAVYLGGIVGAPFMGWVADRVGLRSALASVVLWLAITSVAAAFASSAGSLTFWRFLSGFALGAYPPLMISYLSDVVPVRRRGAMIFLVCAFAYLAPPAVIFAVRWLTPMAPLGVEGWRWPLLAGGLISMLTSIGFLYLPEAPHWLIAAERADKAEVVMRRFDRSRTLWLQPIRSGRSNALRDVAEREAILEPESDSVGAAIPRRRLIFLASAYFALPWATVAFPLISGPLLLARHFSLSDTLLYTGIATFGPVGGLVLGGIIVDRFERRFFMAVCALTMLAAIALFFAGMSVVAVAGALIVFGLFGALYMPTLTMFAAELFSAAVRGRATTIAWVCNRIGAAVAPIALVPLIHQGRYAAIAIIMCGALLVTIPLLAATKPRMAVRRRLS